MNSVSNRFIVGVVIALLGAASSPLLAGCQRSETGRVEQAPPATAAPAAVADAGEAAATAAPGSSLGIPSIPNLRDLGGYTTSDGAVVAHGLVYRANQLSGIGDADMQRLAAVGLRTDYDLRTAEEKDKRPDELPPGVEYVWLNVLADSPQGWCELRRHERQRDRPRRSHARATQRSHAGGAAFIMMKAAMSSTDSTASGVKPVT